MSEPFVGEIRAFGFNYPPYGWAQCNGQQLPVAQYQSLYALIGTRYGGSGQSYFNLPNLQGRTPIHQGAGTGLTARTLAQTGGAATVTLTSSHFPAHKHLVESDTVADPESTDPTGRYISSDGLTQAFKKEVNPSLEVAMAPACLGFTGGNLPHQNLQPTLTLNYCIALDGYFPQHP